MTLSEKTYEPVDCLLCGPSETELLDDQGQFGWPTYVSICKQCGAVFLNPRWTKEGYDHFYAVEYDQYYREDQEQAAEKEQRKFRTVWKRVEKHMGTGFQAALDIGCGLGWGLDYIAQKRPGIKMAGIEPSEICADHFVRQIGGELVASDVDTDWHISHRDRFDLVIFRHVLEHMLDPIGTLKKVNHVLAPSGRLYVAVPDMMHPDGPLHDFWFRSVHTYYFSKTILQRAAAQAGLRALEIKEENSELWAVFEKTASEVGTTGLQVEPGSVYAKQVKMLAQYRRIRLLRKALLLFSPKKLSRFIPKPLKNLVPRDLKNKFRRLVYRH